MPNSTAAHAPPDISWVEAGFRGQALRSTLSNFHIWHNAGRVDGYLASAKNSGMHWIKFMLSHALAHQHGKAPPQHSSGEQGYDFLGPAKLKRRYPDLPNIGHTHTIPSALLAQSWTRPLLRLKPTVLLVRDIREALLSHYVKWREHYDVSLAEYVRAAPGGNRFNADVWWYVLFFNRWGDMARGRAGDILVTRYEDIMEDPDRELRRMAGHWGLELSEAAIAAGVAVSGRNAVAAQQDPGFGEVIVPTAEARASVRLSEEDDAFLSAVFKRHLRHDFGYGHAVPRES